jgi:hypothetical protein
LTVTWEYRILTATNALTDRELNQLGDEGWELAGIASSITSTRQSPVDSSTSYDTQVICVFKREKATQLPFGASAEG